MSNLSENILDSTLTQADSINVGDYCIIDNIPCLVEYYDVKKKG